MKIQLLFWLGLILLIGVKTHNLPEHVVEHFLSHDTNGDGKVERK